MIQIQYFFFNSDNKLLVMTRARIFRGNLHFRVFIAMLKIGFFRFFMKIDFFFVFLRGLIQARIIFYFCEIDL